MHQDQPQRRIEDGRPATPVDWSDVRGAGPTGDSSIVYFFRRRDSTCATWTEIFSQERLDFVKSEPELFILRTLFTVPINDIARAPLSTVAAARFELDRIERRIATAARRVDDLHPGRPLEWDSGCDVPQSSHSSEPSAKSQHSPKHPLTITRNSMNTQDNAAGAALEAAFQIGEAVGGGFYAGLIQIEGVRYALVVAPKVGGECEGIAWLSSEKRIDGADSYNDGMRNTAAMFTGSSELAEWVTALQINGQTDWYLPSQDELEIIYRNLKPTTETNSLYGRSGVNPSSVPPTHAYSRQMPAQTTVPAFAEGGEQTFADEWYWTSTQPADYDDFAWSQNFDDGYQDFDFKSAELRARAVRRFAI